jgi:hypothetical protein
MFSFQQNWKNGQNSFCLEVRGVRGRGRGWGAGGRDVPNNVCTYELKKIKKVREAN